MVIDGESRTFSTAGAFVPLRGSYKDRYSVCSIKFLCPTLEPAAINRGTCNRLRCVRWIQDYWPRCESPFLCVELSSMEGNICVSQCWPSYAKQSTFTQSFVCLLHVYVLHTRYAFWMSLLRSPCMFLHFLPTNLETRTCHLDTTHQLGSCDLRQRCTSSYHANTFCFS